jgi:hypothetical protein
MTVYKEHDLIDDNNELIALFDGWELVERDNVYCFTKNGYRLYHYELGYHSNWSFLIPVWYKFKDLRFENVGHQLEHSNFKTNIAYSICYRNIESAFQSIVSGIQWYNSINK